MNKKTPINIAQSSLDEKLETIEFDESRDRGEWEEDISEVNHPRRKERVNMFKKLLSGLTPYEMMYGKREDDHNYITKSLE